MSGWKAGDWAMVLIVGVDDKYVSIDSGCDYPYVLSPLALCHLPTTTSEDVVIIEAATEVEKRIAQVKSEGPAMHGLYFAALEKLYAAVRARNATRTPAQQETKMEKFKVGDRVKVAMSGFRHSGKTGMIRKIDGIWHEIVFPWRKGFDAPADGEGNYTADALVSLEPVASDEGPREATGGEIPQDSARQSAPSPDIQALEQAVVEAAADQARCALHITQNHASATAAEVSRTAYNCACMATVTASDALRSALNPTPADRVAELREATESAAIRLRVTAMILRANRETQSANDADDEADRLRAALAAMDAKP